MTPQVLFYLPASQSFSTCSFLCSILAKQQGRHRKLEGRGVSWRGAKVTDSWGQSGNSSRMRVPSETTHLWDLANMRLSGYCPYTLLPARPAPSRSCPSEYFATDYRGEGLTPETLYRGWRALSGADPQTASGGNRQLTALDMQETVSVSQLLDPVH